MALKTCSKQWRSVKICQKIPEIKILPVNFLTEISARKTGQIIRKGVYTP